ncbi:MAG TPA: phosphatidylglycerophosphatase A, partial [Terriglobales bacterium]|nr:phosphatidylglycerophosphatase A [Terriglobales bacterium]
ARETEPASPPEESDRPQRTTWAWLLATFFGAGFLRPGPGTWTSALTLVLWGVAARWVPEEARWFAATAVGAVVIAIGIPVSGVVERECGKTDPGFVTIDEVAGQMFALIAVPLRWQYLLASFILFRAFDILKPFPVRRLERLHGGAGIMLDDVGAGLYALAVVQLLLRFHALG